jgi:hypothetical protein
LQIYVVMLSSPTMTDETLRNLLNSAGVRCARVSPTWVQLHFAPFWTKHQSTKPFHRTAQQASRNLWLSPTAAAVWCGAVQVHLAVGGC